MVQCAARCQAGIRGRLARRALQSRLQEGRPYSYPYPHPCSYPYPYPYPYS